LISITNAEPTCYRKDRNLLKKKDLGGLFEEESIAEDTDPGWRF
jgi:hypothetical protein